MCGELSCGDVNLTVVNWVPKIIQRAKKNEPAISITTIIERARLDQLAVHVVSVVLIALQIFSMVKQPILF